MNTAPAKEPAMPTPPITINRRPLLDMRPSARVPRYRQKARHYLVTLLPIGGSLK